MRTTNRPAQTPAAVAFATSMIVSLAAACLSCGGGAGAGLQVLPTSDPGPVLAPDEVQGIMNSAARATNAQVAVAVTDRRGVILGVATNFGFDYANSCAQVGQNNVCPLRPGGDCAIVDLAVQMARTGAFFSADQTPLTSRSVRFISDVHFPTGVKNTAAAALFGIENTNRGCSFDVAEGDGYTGVPRALSLESAVRQLAGQPALRCESATDPAALCGCTAGIATLPGGVPIFKNGRHAGGIGVAVRGVTLTNDVSNNPDDPTNPAILRKAANDPLFSLGEFAARAFAGDPSAIIPTIVNKGLKNVCATADAPACCTASPACTLSIVPVGAPPPFDVVIFIDGIEVPEVDDNPTTPPNPGSYPPFQASDFIIAPGAVPGSFVPTGDLIAETGSTPGAQPLSQDEVGQIVQAVIAQADQTRAAIRLPLQARARFIIAISDTSDKLVALFRQADATVFSIDVAVAKSRNVLHFSDPNISPVQDIHDQPATGVDLGLAFPPGTAVTNRTLSFSAQPFFPSGIDGTVPGPFRAIFFNDLANACTNGHQTPNGRLNGIVFFPGSAPLYRNGVLIGGLGISGDGVEQDDLATAAGTIAGPNFSPPVDIEADQFSVRGIRLPYLKFNRQPEQ